MKPKRKQVVLTEVEKSENRVDEKKMLIVVGLFLVAIVLLIGVLNKFNPAHEQKAGEQSVPVETTITHKTEVLDDDSFFGAVLSQNTTNSEKKEEIQDFYMVDRQQLQAINHAVGYINIDGTYIQDYIVQGVDNAYYLNTDIYGNASEKGALFCDYRNQIDVLDCNNIVYGHNMADGTMFGTLQRLHDEEFFKKDGAYKPCYINLGTLCYDNIFEVYSVYTTDLTSFNYIQVEFEDSTAFNDFMVTTRERNDIAVLDSLTVPKETKILTLSTCVDDDTRLVVHAYLYNRRVV